MIANKQNPLKRSLNTTASQQSPVKLSLNTTPSQQEPCQRISQYDSQQPCQQSLNTTASQQSPVKRSLNMTASQQGIVYDLSIQQPGNKALSNDLSTRQSDNCRQMISQYDRQLTISPSKTLPAKRRTETSCVYGPVVWKFCAARLRIRLFLSSPSYADF